jgi:hypothetical protein
MYHPDTAANDWEAGKSRVTSYDCRNLIGMNNMSFTATLPFEELAACFEACVFSYPDVPTVTLVAKRLD